MSSDQTFEGSQFRGNRGGKKSKMGRNQRRRGNQQEFQRKKHEIPYIDESQVDWSSYQQKDFVEKAPKKEKKEKKEFVKESKSKTNDVFSFGYTALPQINVPLTVPIDLNQYFTIVKMFHSTVQDFIPVNEKIPLNDLLVVTLWYIDYHILTIKQKTTSLSLLEQTRHSSYKKMIGLRGSVPYFMLTYFDAIGKVENDGIEFVPQALDFSGAIIDPRSQDYQCTPQQIESVAGNIMTGSIADNHAVRGTALSSLLDINGLSAPLYSRYQTWVNIIKAYFKFELDYKFGSKEYGDTSMIIVYHVGNERCQTYSRLAATMMEKALCLQITSSRAFGRLPMLLLNYHIGSDQISGIDLANMLLNKFRQNTYLIGN